MGSSARGMAAAVFENFALLPVDPDDQLDWQGLKITDRREHFAVPVIRRVGG